jgi:indole-3-glycerol phosphate synthase
LSSLIPPDAIAVAESSIRSLPDAQQMAAAGFDAVLVGEALVRSNDATGLVRDFAATAVQRRG